MNKITPIMTAINFTPLTFGERENITKAEIIIFLQSLLPAEEAMMKEVWEAGVEYGDKYNYDAPNFNQFISQHNKK